MDRIREITAKLYNNVGKVLMVVAKIIGVFGVLAVAGGIIAVIVILIAGSDYDMPIALGVLSGGITLFISSFPLYAFGQVADDVHFIREK